MSTVTEKRINFLQIPNVFFETCALPDGAQMLFLRMATYLNKNRLTEFTGSIRQIACAVRMSKSTVDRMLKKLQTSKLVQLTHEPGAETGREVMNIKLNIDKLWELNTYHNTVAPVPTWDKLLPDCPTLGQIVPDLGHDNINLGQFVPLLGQTVPASSSNEGGRESNTDNKNSNIEKEGTFTPSLDSSFNKLIQWIRDERIEGEAIIVARDAVKVKQQVQLLASCVKDKEELHKFCLFVHGRITGDDKRLRLGNLVNERVLDDWAYWQKQEQAAQTIVVEVSEALPELEADEIIEAIRHEYPDIVLQPGQDEQGSYIGLVYGEDKHNPGELLYVEIRSKRDWQDTQGDAWVINRAMTYGKECKQAA